MFFLVNPKKKRRAGVRRSKRRATKSRTRRKRAMPAALKAYWASKRGGSTMARRRKRRKSSGRARSRRRSVVRSNPVRRHRRRRSFRRNPSIGRGVIGQAIQGMKCGAFILAGEGASTMVAGFVPMLGNTGIIGGLKIGLIGTLLGSFGGRFLKGYTREFVGGAWAKAIRTAVPVASIPLIGSSLSGYTPSLIAPSRLSGYAPRSSGAGMSASDDGSGYSF